jgi:GTP-binding protein Era
MAERKPRTKKSAAGESGTAQSGAAQSGAAQSGAARSDTARSGVARSGGARSGSARSGAARSGSAQTGSARSGAAQSGAARSGTARSGAAQGQGRPSGDRRSTAHPAGEQPSEERRLTPGERNAKRREERQRAKREERNASEGGRKPGGATSGAAGGRPSSFGGTRGAQSRGTGATGRPRRSGTPTGPTSAAGKVGKERGRDGAVDPRPDSRTEKGFSQRVHRHKPARSDKRDDGVYRAGFACFVGRPNAGKSTLTNAIVGQKIAITSNKPQTTRHVIRGILHRPDAQLVLVDTPGLHRPRTLLGERLNDLVREVWSEVDVIGICFPADEPVGRGDRFISSEMAELKATVIAVVTKVDLVSPQVLAQRLLAISQLYDFAEIIPVSAVSGHQVEQLTDVMVKHMPESPQLYPDDTITDEPEQVLIGELIREAALEGVRDELPHSIAVLVEEMMVEGKTTKIFADLYVERSSQKSIVIGTRGERLKQVGSQARVQIEELLGTRVYLDLHVRVAKEWQRDPKQLRKLGF